MDYLVSDINLYEESENTSFSMKMMQILSTLSPENLSFIMLKYQENYDDEDLARYFNLTISNIKQKEEEILFLLKGNDDVKLLKK